MIQSVEIVVPARNMRSHIGRCVKSLVPQLGVSDLVTVIDDGSDDGTAEAARDAGARVRSLTTSRGPYGARQLAAGKSVADALIFVDARCRALPGLLNAHRELLARDGVALSCTNVQILSGKTFATKVAAESGLFAVDSKIGVPGHIDFFPTCNLGVRRKAFMEIGGFRDMRSGGDADLCFRLQLEGYGRVAADPRTLMEWIPRDSFRALAEQAVRYGRSGAALDSLYQRHRRAVAPPVEAPSAARSSAARRISGYVVAVGRQSRREPNMIANRLVGRSLALIQAGSRTWYQRRPELLAEPPLLPFID